MDKRYNVLISLLAMLALISVGVAIWAVWFRDAAPVLAPDAPPVTEVITPTNDAGDEKLPQPEGGGAVSVTCAGEAFISLRDKAVTLMFANPSPSNQSMVASMVIQGGTVAQSSLLEPGSQVTRLPLLDTAQLSPGVYEGSYHVQIYNSDGTQSTISTDLPVSVTVTA